MRTPLFGRLRWVAIELDKGDNIHAGREVQKVLLEAHQEVVDLAGLGLGLVLRDLAEAEGMTFSVVKELAMPGFRFLMNRGHCCTSAALCWRFERGATERSQQCYYTVNNCMVNTYNVTAT